MSAISELPFEAQVLGGACVVLALAASTAAQRGRSRRQNPRDSKFVINAAKDAKDAKDKEAPRKRDETPPNVKAARLTVQNLTRNVGGEHLKEIFGTFGYVC